MASSLFNAAHDTSGAIIDDFDSEEEIDDYDDSDNIDAEWLTRQCAKFLEANPDIPFQTNELVATLSQYLLSKKSGTVHLRLVQHWFVLTLMHSRHRTPGIIT